MKFILGKRFILFLFFLSTLAQVFCQDTERVVIDSIQRLINISNDLTFEYKIKESLEYAIKAVNHAHTVDNDYYKGQAYYLMGYNYSTLVDYKSAEVSYRKALEFSTKAKDSILMLWSYNGLGNVYSDGYKDLKTSLDYYNRAKKLGEILEKEEEYMTPIINLAWAYLDIKEPDTAFPFLEEAEELVKKTRDIQGYCEVMYLQGRYHLQKDEYDKARLKLSEAIEIAEQHNMLVELSYVFESRAELYQKTGKMDSAFQDLKAYQLYKDKLYDKEKLKQIEIAKISFGVDEYERQLNVAKAEKEYQEGISRNNRIINIVSIVGVVLLLVIIFFVYKGYKSKEQINEVLRAKNDQLVEAKLEAEKLAQAKSQFVSTISHELRTPLYGVIGITSLLLEDEKMQPNHKKLLGSLKFSGDYLLNLINNVLRISKIESQELTPTKTPTNLFKLSQNLLNSFEYQAKNKNNQLVLDLPKDLPETVNVDSLGLSEVLVNLIGNSSKFTENGNIWLRIKILDQNDQTIKIRYEVEDNGLGIPEDKKDFIFEKFSQLDRESNQVEGTGLGLSIVKNILTLMNSEIHLETKEGRGTKFYFDLDLDILNETDDESLKIEENTPGNSYGKILVAEDNKINQIVTKNLLNLIGYDCTIVENGFNAIQMVKKEDFDLILMDLNMPYVDGREATKRIREFDQNTPIIALTAAELGEVKDECMDIGMNDLINKPLNKNDLKKIIKKNLKS